MANRACSCVVPDTELITVAIGDDAVALLIHFVRQTKPLILGFNGQFELERSGRSKLLTAARSTATHLIHTVEESDQGLIESKQAASVSM